MITDPEDDVFYDEINALSRQFIDTLTALPPTEYNEQIILAALALVTSLVIETSGHDNLRFFLHWFEYYMEKRK
jgi:hypothetical protein